MTMECPVSADAGLVTGLLGSVDCTTQDMLAGGYAALAAPTGPVALAITGALTLYVGFYGLRLLTGRGTIDVGGASMMAVKIGLVLVLAGNWALYQQLVCRTLFDGPQQIAGLVLGGFHRPGSVLSPEPLVALQQAFDELMRDVRSLATHAGDRSPLLGGPAFATMMLNAAAYGLVFASAGTLAVTHIGLTLLLALGPVMAGFLLFDATRGLIEGWLRAAIALALISLAIVLLLPIELAMIEPALIALATQRTRDAITPETAMAACFVVGVFAAAGTGSLFGAWAIARGIRLPLDAQPRPAAAVAAASVLVRTAPTLSRAERIAATMTERRVGPTDRRAARAGQAMAMHSAFATGDRSRALPAGGTVVDSQFANNQRAARPRRELLVARRKK